MPKREKEEIGFSMASPKAAVAVRAARPVAVVLAVAQLVARLWSPFVRGLGDNVALVVVWPGRQQEPRVRVLVGVNGLGGGAELVIV